MSTIAAKVRATEALESLPLELTITMTVGDWRKVAEQQDGSWAGWKVGALIRDAIQDVARATAALRELRNVGDRTHD